MPKKLPLARLLRDLARQRRMIAGLIERANRQRPPILGPRSQPPASDCEAI